jgi:trehalose 6-phosphate synthase
MAGVPMLLELFGASSQVARIGEATYMGVFAAFSHIIGRGQGAVATATGTVPSDVGTSRTTDFTGCAVRAQRPPTDIAAPDIRGRLRPDQQIIVLSNREPCIHEHTAAGEVVCRRPASGLVAALEPVVQACGGVWVAHGSGSADRIVSDDSGHVLVKSDDSDYLLRRVWLSSEEERGYYRGFANEGLWPLCHVAFAAPVFRRSDWIAYERVNRRFADAVAAEIRTDQPIVLIQDYHFALVPGLLRQRCPDAITVAFWHIPWPAAEQFSRCPYGREIVNGLLGSDILGFQTAAHCRNFLNCADEDNRRGIDRQRNLVFHAGGTVHVRPYPISVEWPNRWMSGMPSIDQCRRTVRAEFGIDPTRQLVLSVDRLDYTKGFEERLAAVERLLETAGFRRNVAFLQIAAPTRVAIDRYTELADRVRKHVARINRRFGDQQFTPVTYVERYLEPPDVFRCYRAADVCYVGSLDDGMNLVAKEFVAARDDERGALVLSRFAGAAQELTDALIVNPYDVDGVADAFARALDLTSAEQESRMRRMRLWIAQHHVYRWAWQMLADATHVRQPAYDHAAPVESSQRLFPAQTM